MMTKFVFLGVKSVKSDSFFDQITAVFVSIRKHWKNPTNPKLFLNIKK